MIRLKIVDFDKRFPQVTELLIGKDKQYYEDMKNNSVDGEEVQQIEVSTQNKEVDLNMSDTFSDKFQSLNDQVDMLSEDLTGTINTESGQMFSRPANSPNTTVTVFKQTSSNTPFTNLMSNKHLSLNKTQEAELLRYIK